MTIADVFGLAGKQLQVLNDIIGRIAVNVVDHLFRVQVTTKVLFHDKSVF